MARRLLRVLTGPRRRPGCRDAGAGDPARPARTPGRLLKVLDEAARPKVTQATADEIFLVLPQNLWVHEREMNRP